MGRLQLVNVTRKKASGGFKDWKKKKSLISIHIVQVKSAKTHTKKLIEGINLG